MTFVKIQFIQQPNLLLEDHQTRYFIGSGYYKVTPHFEFGSGPLDQNQNQFDSN